MTGMLDGKAALVTGGGSGIGRATAIAMAREGARVAVSDLSKEGIDETVALINAAGGQSIAIQGDVTDEADVANMVARTVSAFGRIDCAFNNAGIEEEHLPLADADVTESVVLGAVAGRRRGPAAEAFVRASRAKSWADVTA